MLSAYSSEDASEEQKLFFETHLILDIQTTLTLQRSHCKDFWWNYNKNESCMLYVGKKEQQWLFLVSSLSEMHIDFDFARPFLFFFFACTIGQIEVNLLSPAKFAQPWFLPMSACLYYTIFCFSFLISILKNFCF